MQTKIYVDVLLVLNYIINTLLVMCTAKLTGRSPGKKRTTLSALGGAVGSLVIFLPYMGIPGEIAIRILLAAVIIRIAFVYISAKNYFKQLFIFFAVSFFFGGLMLALTVMFAPGLMTYYNGVVYFNISPISLIVSTAAAYALLSLAHRFSRDGRLKTSVYLIDVHMAGKQVQLEGFLDSGNSLYEPFSGAPVIVCSLAAVEKLLPEAVCSIIRSGGDDESFAGCGLPVRFIPYSAVGINGMLPAFRPQWLILHSEKQAYRAEDVFLAVTTGKIAANGCNAILNPDIIGANLRKTASLAF